MGTSDIELTNRLTDPGAFELSDSDDSAFGPSSSSRAGLLGDRTSRKPNPRHHTPPRWARWLFWYPSTGRSPRRRFRRCRNVCSALAGAVAALTVINILFFPSYTKSLYPPNYNIIEDSVRSGGGINPAFLWHTPPDSDGHAKTTTPGRGNPNNERIFIAANIVDAELITSEWGDRVMELLDLLGPKNVFLSIFENDSGNATTQALQTLDQRIAAHMPDAGRAIVSTTLPLDSVPRLKLPDKTTYIKRISYLAEIRNRALLPLVGAIPSLARWNQSAHPEFLTPTSYPLSKWEVLAPLASSDLTRKPALPPNWVNKSEGVTRILFLNDVVFSPLELLHLLFSTHNGSYAAACGADYINPLKFYDTFATRDPAGYPLGVPFFPYFATEGPRAQVLASSDAVDVASCWGGAIAFNASYFTRETEPVRFRSEKEPFWDASECCLVNADLAAPGEVFMNPFVRSAYTRRTFNWLPVVRRFERLFHLPHRILVRLLAMPWPGSRRHVEEGEVYTEKAWDGEGWVEWNVTAGKGMWCGGRKLLVMNEHRKPGERSWMGLELPPVPE